ncbi:hypothetical protein DSO57_1020538 [Entomophthora muscae]|uniref:Uncharacterized protein n=1 Tax=Entomophthora muscae TaxID=34485 RepID=A0ACC2RUQ9_9FUNG|nr:hypothetical protein DSO57_1020538 [Entomophthora muscae]
MEPQVILEPTFVHKLAQAEFETLYRGGELESLEKPKDTSKAWPRKKDLLIQYCQGTPEDDCSEVFLKKVTYHEPITPWKCLKHSGAYPAPKFQNLHCNIDLQRLLDLPNTGAPSKAPKPAIKKDDLKAPVDCASEVAAVPPNVLYLPNLVVPDFITRDDKPGILYVHIFRSPKMLPGPPLFYYRFGGYIDANSVSLDDCPKFCELKWSGHSPIVSRLEHYPTPRLRTLKFHLNCNLVNRNFKRLTADKVAAALAFTNT